MLSPAGRSAVRAWFGVCVADMDGDGHEDVFLSQNFFATPAEMCHAWMQAAACEHT